MKKTDLAYFAGIIDGEGNISLVKTRDKNTTEFQRDTFSLTVGVTNTNGWICEQLKFAFGGSVYLRHIKGKPKDTYKWSLYGVSAVHFLKVILPYLCLKRRQAELAIQFQNHKTIGGYKTNEYMDFEHELKSIMTQLNQKGKSIANSSNSTNP